MSLLDFPVIQDPDTGEEIIVRDFENTRECALRDDQRGSWQKALSGRLVGNAHSMARVERAAFAAMCLHDILTVNLVGKDLERASSGVRFDGIDAFHESGITDALAILLDLIHRGVSDLRNAGDPDNNC